MVAAENLVVAIAESQLAWFNVQGFCDIPGKVTERRRECVASTRPDSFFTLVKVTLTDNTGGYPSGHLFHEANYYSILLRVSV